MKTAIRSELHPIEQLRQELGEKDLIVLHNVTNLPGYADAYVSPYLTIGLCTSGKAWAKHDMHSVVFQEGDLSVIPPNHATQGIECTQDYSCTLVVISEKLDRDLRAHISFRHHLTYHQHPSFHLTPDQQSIVHHCIQVLEDISDSTSPMRMEMLSASIGILFEFLNDWRQLDQRIARGQTRNELLFARFYDLIVENYSRTREVGFFAKELCISPKHFATVIKATTGLSPGDWISNYVVAQSKHYLYRRRDLSIAQIAQLMGFVDLASFSRYIKKNTGKAPREFRSV